MPTHAIGSGTVNMTLNVPMDERDLWGRAAVSRRAKSVGDFQKHLMLLGLARIDPERAEEIKAVRQMYYGTALLILLMTGQLAALFGGQANDLRRPPSSVRVARSVKRNREEV